MHLCEDKHLTADIPLRHKDVVRQRYLVLKPHPDALEDEPTRDAAAAILVSLMESAEERDVLQCRHVSVNAVKSIWAHSDSLSYQF
eukprot:SAG11_NODE_260_length_11531_cov_6.271781_9_plen_86_part_00